MKLLTKAMLLRLFVAIVGICDEVILVSSSLYSLSFRSFYFELKLFYWPYELSDHRLPYRFIPSLPTVIIILYETNF